MARTSFRFVWSVYGTNGGEIGIQHPGEAPRDRDHRQPEPPPQPRPHHRRRHLGARVLPPVPQRQGRRECSLLFTVSLRLPSLRSIGCFVTSSLRIFLIPSLPPSLRRDSEYELTPGIRLVPHRHLERRQLRGGRGSLRRGCRRFQALSARLSHTGQVCYFPLYLGVQRVGLICTAISVNKVRSERTKK